MSSDATTVPVTALAGPPLLSLVLNWGLFGVLSVQAYLYCNAFPRDPWRLKLMVCVVYTLETTQVLLLTKSVWDTLASGFGNMEVLNSIGPYTWLSVCVIGGAVAFSVQTFYAYRIRAISHNSYISLIVILMSMTSLIGAFLSGIAFAQVQFFDRILDHTRLNSHTLVGVWLASGSACDVVIAVSMCYYLRKRVRGINFPSTRRLISKLIRMTIETGSLTASVSVASLALFYVSALQLDWGIPLSATAKLYSTTMLAVLNSRNLTTSTESISWRCETCSSTMLRTNAHPPEHVQLQIVCNTGSPAERVPSPMLFAEKSEGSVDGVTILQKDQELAEV